MSQETTQRAIQRAKEQVTWGCRTMVNREYVLGTVGNISAGVEGEPLFVATPSTRPYLTMEPEDLTVGDMDGNVVPGPYRPSIESSMHLGIYKERPEVNCIVHTHSKFAAAVNAIDDVGKVPVINVEGAVYLSGEILMAPFTPPGSGEPVAHIRNTIGTDAGPLMASHGAIGTGLTMEDAMISSGNVERACEMYLAILEVGCQIRKLPEDYMEMTKKKSLARRNVVLQNREEHMERRIAAIHTIVATCDGISGRLKALVPDTKMMNIVDGNLLNNVKKEGMLTREVTRRLLTYTLEAQSWRAELTLNARSSVEGGADVIRPLLRIPYLKTDEPMVRNAVEKGEKIAVYDMVKTTLGPSARLISHIAEAEKKRTVVDSYLTSDAFGALTVEKNQKKHDQILEALTRDTGKQYDVLVLAQASMSVLISCPAGITRPILSSMDSGVEATTKALEGLQERLRYDIKMYDR